MSDSRAAQASEVRLFKLNQNVQFESAKDKFRIKQHLLR